jgi:hypothetical protein
LTENGVNPLEGVISELSPDVVERMLRQQLGDQRAALTDLEIQPFRAASSYSGNNSHCRLQLAWTADHTRSPGSADWIIKRWQPGGLFNQWMGVNQPQEALGWRDGLLRPEGLPAGVTVPYVGSKVSPDGTSAWTAMTDVSAELGEYSSAHPLPPEQVLVRVRHALDGMARLHAWWEQPAQQEKLAQCEWLTPWEWRVWTNAATYAYALDRQPAGGHGMGLPATEGRRANLRAFLDWLAPRDREMWTELLCDRRPLLAAIPDVPLTLLHGDPDQRHIGLRWLEGPGTESSELVLIDWEATSRGLGAWDVKHLLLNVPSLCDPAQPCPDFCLSGELEDYYFERYLAEGGRSVTPELWPRAYELGGLVTLMESIPLGAGNRLRTLQGLVPPRHIEGLTEEEMLARTQAAWDRTQLTIERATRALRTYLA